jgi:hypothetical protein
MAPLAFHVGRVLANRPKPVILLQAAHAGWLRGFQLCDAWNLATLATEPTRDVSTLRRSYPGYAFILVSPNRSNANPPEQWEAIGNPAGFFRSH